MNTRQSTRRAEEAVKVRLDRAAQPTLRNWQQPRGPHAEKMRSDVALDMGWGRLIFAHTFHSTRDLVDTLCAEESGRRDIAFYLRDPHVALSMAPQRLFLDPSHTYRLWADQYHISRERPRAFRLRRVKTRADAEALNRVWAGRKMVTCDPGFILDRHANRLRTYFLAESIEPRRVVGAVMGVDHVEAFDDPENGSSLWCLAVSTECRVPGVGEWLVRQMAEHYFARGRQYLDLSVMHDNTQAIRLYEKLGFRRVPVFCVKLRNAINEPLFAGPRPEESLNVYARIITDEARRRGIDVEVLDAEAGYFRLTLGGRSITCRESLTEMTTAIAMSRCDDKRVTRRLFEQAHLHVPAQRLAGEPTDNHAFLEAHGAVVVKPARGEQGHGVCVDIATTGELDAAVEEARHHGPEVILEQMVNGEDLRVIVIDGQVVAAAVRRPPIITGTGEHTVEQLLNKYNRRRRAATQGESAVPLDEQTHRCVAAAGLALDAVLPVGESITVRKTANLHTGGTIHDVTHQMSDSLRQASIAAAEAIGIPVVGLDFIIQRVDGDDYALIEANERPGLANHEPQPTAQKFIDFLFPQTAK